MESHEQDHDAGQAGREQSQDEAAETAQPTNEPRGNAPLDEEELARGIDKLEQAGGGH